MMRVAIPCVPGWDRLPGEIAPEALHASLSGLARRLADAASVTEVRIVHEPGSPALEASDCGRKVVQSPGNFSFRVIVDGVPPGAVESASAAAEGEGRWAFVHPRALFLDARDLDALASAASRTPSAIAVAAIPAGHSNPAWGMGAWRRRFIAWVRGGAAGIPDVRLVRPDSRADVELRAGRARVTFDSASAAGGVYVRFAQVGPGDRPPQTLFAPVLGLRAEEFPADHGLAWESAGAGRIAATWKVEAGRRYALMLVEPCRGEDATHVLPFSLPGWVEYRAGDDQRVVSATGKVVRGRQDLPPLWTAAGSAAVATPALLRAAAEGGAQLTPVELSAARASIVRSRLDWARGLVAAGRAAVPAGCAAE